MPSSRPRRPAWTAEDERFGPNWASHGYGLQRALNRMADEVAAATEQGSASAALREHGAPALRCIENTQGRADRLLSLSQQALAGGAAAVPTLEQIKEQAEALNRGVPGAGRERLRAAGGRAPAESGRARGAARLSATLRPGRAPRHREASVPRSPRQRRT